MVEWAKGWSMGEKVNQRARFHWGRGENGWSMGEKKNKEQAFHRGARGGVEGAGGVKGKI